MAETSGLHTGANFTDAVWGAIIGGGGLSGIVNDLTGNSYNLTLSSTDNTATIAAGTSVVYGWNHSVSGTTTLQVPAVAGSNTTRTHIIALTYDPADAVDPYPVQLNLYSGVEGGGAPALTPPTGGLILPLWQIVRSSGVVLSQSAVTDMRRWAGPSQALAVGSPLPSTAVPLGMVLHQGGVVWSRQMISGAPAWVPDSAVDHIGTVATVAGSNITGSYGLTSTGLPVNMGVLFANRPCTVSVQFAIDFTGAAGASCTINLGYALNGGSLITTPSWTAPTGALVGGDNPRAIIPADIQLAAGDSLKLNASITAVVGSLSWYAPQFNYTARAAVHV